MLHSNAFQAKINVYSLMWCPPISSKVKKGLYLHTIWMKIISSKILFYRCKIHISKSHMYQPLYVHNPKNKLMFMYELFWSVTSPCKGFLVAWHGFSFKNIENIDLQKSVTRIMYSACGGDFLVQRIARYPKFWHFFSWKNRWFHRI